MAVTEGQRQAYLRELGIQVYYPRRALPGAKPSAHYVSSVLVKPAPCSESADVGATMLSALLNASVVQSVAVPAATATHSVIPSVTSSAANLPVTPPGARVHVNEPKSVPAPSSLPAPSVSPLRAEPAEEARFAFAYFPINEDLAVINELPWAKSAAVSPACRQLLAAILKALTISCDEKTLTSMVFTWPLEDDADSDRSAMSARHMLDGFMARRFKLRPVRYLLVLAEQSAGFLFPEGHDWQQEGLRRHPQHSVDVIITRSLNAMDAVPEIKRSVWQALQPLRAALANSSGNGR